MASPLARRVARAIRRRGLWRDDDRVAVAVSGGPDSVALTLLLAELAPGRALQKFEVRSSPLGIARGDVSDSRTSKFEVPRGARWQLAGLIHVDHQLRGAESDADASFCAALAARLDLPIDRTSVDVTSHAARERRSLEASARELRYAAFAAAATRLGATVVVTGHTADDQAETVLLRLLRGATMRGVSAIRWRRGLYARPLLECRRAELRAYLDERGEAFREDSSNADETIPRNRLRRTLMPAIDAMWPGGVRAFARFAELAADDEALLTRMAEECGVPVRSAADGVELERGPLAALPAPIARRVVRAGVEAAGGRPAARDVEAVLRLTASSKQRGRLTLHGVDVDVEADRVRIGRERPSGPRVAFEHELPVPGEVEIRETRVRLRASLLSGPERPAGAPGVAVLQASAVAAPLTVRTRRPGDRFRPLGAPGSKTLQDLLVDRKVPRMRRQAVPVVVDRDGRIVWVAGVEIAHDCRVTRPEDGMVKLELVEKGIL
jgi:tRNA(Ile)-lysidine synthase